MDELLKEEIATILPDLRDPRVGFVTVMDVKVSPDLRHAQVYVSVLGDEEEKKASMAALERAAGYVRGRVGEAITLKYLPKLQFHLDRTIQRAARIDTLIDEMRADVGEAGEEDADGTADDAAGETDAEEPGE